MLLTACNFSNLFKPTIRIIEIEDRHGQYQIGDVFLNDNELTITATYSDQTKKTLTLDNEELNPSLYYYDGNIKNVHSLDTPFQVARDYKFVVTSGVVSSNEITISVIKEHVYVSSLAIECADEMEVGETIDLRVNVEPETYTTALSFDVSKKNLLSITYDENDKSLVHLKARKSGELDITVSSLSSKDTTISETHHLKINGSSSAVAMEQNYNDLVKHSLYPISATPLYGSPKLLVIPTWFTDSSKYITSNTNKANVKADIEKAYFGSNSETGWYSVKTFYEYESEGLLSLSGTVSDWYECGYSSYQVGAKREYTNRIVENAVDWYFKNNPSDSRANYDYDKDGIMDGVMLIYAAPDYSALKNDDLTNLWAYCFWLQKNRVGVIYPNAYFWASYDFMYGNNARSRAGTSYSSGYTRYISVDAHTYIHEMGHMFGLDDYYDYSGKYNPAGGFSMQDYNIGGHDPFSLIAFGWADPYIPETSTTITINSFSDYHDSILLTPEFNDYFSPFDEYLLIELFTPTSTNEMDVMHSYCGGYPTGSSVPGIRLWHVDARLAKWTYDLDDNVYVPALADSANALDEDITLAFTNTYNEDDVQKDYLSPLGEKYYENNILQLIRNYSTATYHMDKKKTLTTEDLFLEGDSFSMNTFSKQFINGNKLNNGKSLEWTFTVDKIATVDGVTSATITLTRAA